MSDLCFCCALHIKMCCFDDEQLNGLPAHSGYPGLIVRPFSRPGTKIRHNLNIFPNFKTVNIRKDRKVAVLRTSLSPSLVFVLNISQFCPLLVSVCTSCETVNCGINQGGFLLNVIKKTYFNIFVPFASFCTFRIKVTTRVTL